MQVLVAGPQRDIGFADRRIHADGDSTRPVVQPVARHDLGIRRRNDDPAVRTLTAVQVFLCGTRPGDWPDVVVVSVVPGCGQVPGLVV